MGGYRLGVDFGTSTTVAVLRWPDGAIKPLWDLRTRRQVATFGGKPVDPREGTMAASPKTGVIATTWNSPRIRLWTVTAA